MLSACGVALSVVGGSPFYPGGIQRALGAAPAGTAVHGHDGDAGQFTVPGATCLLKAVGGTPARLADVLGEGPQGKATRNASTTSLVADVAACSKG